MDVAAAPCHCGGVSADHDLLERSYHLSVLRDALVTTQAERRGVLVLLGGEAGGGKTALLRRFVGTYEPAGRVLWGSCDPLFTPRPLGPFLDIALDVVGSWASW
jgi:predicted ATPase